MLIITKQYIPQQFSQKKLLGKIGVVPIYKASRERKNSQARMKSLSLEKPLYADGPIFMIRSISIFFFLNLVQKKHLIILRVIRLTVSC